MTGSPLRQSPGELAWIRDAVAYQVFVDRFACVGAAAPRHPGPHEFMGGDLRGVAGRLGYLADLGINLVSLTPIFASTSNHRYNTCDYHRIDPRLGTIDDFRALLAEARRHGIRILLDGVFNHCGRGFYPFVDVMENGAASAYREWFYIDGYPVDAYGAHRYSGWQGVASLPEFNLSNTEVRAFLLEVARSWSAEDIAGWRLDAVRHARDREFWGELRRVVKAVNPQCYLFAEIWEDPAPWLNAGYFDGATNYRFRALALRFLVDREITASAFARELQSLVSGPAWNATTGMWNLLGSHDTPRVHSVIGDSPVLAEPLFMLQLFVPGIPAIYYGDEIGLRGDDESRNRRPMEWSPDGGDPRLRSRVKQLVTLRRNRPALQCGDWRTLSVDDDRGVCAFRRRYEGDSAILVIRAHAKDAGTASVTLRGLESDRYDEPLSEESYFCNGGELRIGGVSPGTGRLLVSG